MQNLIVETKMFNLSTRGSACNILNEDPNYKSKCEYNIRDMVVRDEDVEYIQFSVPFAIIPVSFFTVNQNNNQLKILVNGSTTTYTFPQGNYNANTFITQFSLTLGAYYKLSLSAYNNVFTITRTLQDGFNFTILGVSSISSIMGFSTNMNGIFVSPNYVITCSRCCNFLPLPRITMRCPELANTQMVGSSSSNDVIITIPNNSKPNGQLYYINSSNAKLFFRQHELSRFIISLTDDDGNYLNFNGVSSFFTLQFDIYRKFAPKLPSFSNIVNSVNNTLIKRYFEEKDNEDINGYV